MFIYLSMSLTCINYFQFRFNRILSDTKYNVDVKIKKIKYFLVFLGNFGPWEFQTGTVVKGWRTNGNVVGVSLIKGSDRSSDQSCGGCRRV